jgi:hypothetical protein
MSGKSTPTSPTGSPSGFYKSMPFSPKRQKTCSVMSLLLLHDFQKRMWRDFDNTSGDASTRIPVYISTAMDRDSEVRKIVVFKVRKRV